MRRKWPNSQDFKFSVLLISSPLHASNSCESTRSTAVCLDLQVLSRSIILSGMKPRV